MDHADRQSGAITVQGVALSASDADTVVYPNLVNSKTVSVVTDPIRGTGVAGAPALYIPGAVAQYAIQLSNTGLGRVDTDTVAVTDPIPANTSLYFPLAARARPGVPLPRAGPAGGRILAGWFRRGLKRW